jgi:hypothetical protein
MGDILRLPVRTRLDCLPERTIQDAIEANLESVVIMGYDKDGDEYFASSIADSGTVLWLLERLKRQLLASGEE